MPPTRSTVELGGEVCDAATVPELPEVESARGVIERSALGRRVKEVDDADSYVSRPHRPGELRDALRGRSLTAVHRRGKLLWCETSGTGRSRTPGPTLALHLGMAGRVLVDEPSGSRDAGGDYGPAERRGDEPKDEWARFTLHFSDGGRLRLVDKRRLGRVYLDPDVDVLGPDAGEVGLRDFRELIGASRSPIKARLLDQHALAGVGNLLADEVLWRSKIDPHRRADELERDEVSTLHQELGKAIRATIRGGGVHTAEIVDYRKAGEHCPRCGGPMRKGTVGGRTTWWCSEEQ